MDVVLDRKPFAVSGSTPGNPATLCTAELLLAAEFSELVAEVRQLRHRRIDTVSIRRQRARRIGLSRLKMVLEDAGMRVCTIGFAGGFTGTLNRSYRQAVDDTRRALEFAAELNARAVVVLPGGRGRHIYNHAERTIRDGLLDCLDDALRLRVDMLVPLTTVLGGNNDVFQPRRRSPLQWLQEYESHRILPMMMLRQRNPLRGLPACWKQVLQNGGALRIGRRCRKTIGSHNIVAEILSRLSDVTIPVG